MIPNDLYKFVLLQCNFKLSTQFQTKKIILESLISKLDATTIK